MKRLLTFLLCAFSIAVASPARAQVLGTFSWQMQPYCNVVTMTLTGTPTGYTLDGSDNQCGANNQASAVGHASFNASGNVTLNFSIVLAPSGKAVHVSAIVSPATGGGTWTDSVGNSGTFAFFANTAGLPQRPLPSSGLAAAIITSAELAPGAVGSAAINTAQVQSRVSGTCAAGQMMTGVNANGTVICASAGAVGSKSYVGSFSTTTDVLLSNFTFVAPLTGAALFRTRGYCNVNRQTAVNNELHMGILLPGETVDGVAGSFERTGTIRLPALNPAESSGAFALGYTGERIVNVTQGVSYSVDLKGNRFSSSDTGSCRGTFSVELFATVIP